VSLPQATRITFAWLVLCLATASAGYEKGTHQRLSAEAFARSDIASHLQEAYGIGESDVFRQRLFGVPWGSRTAGEWLVAGGHEEDVPVWRVLNHFFDPNRGVGLGILGGMAAPDWALEPDGPVDGQNHSYRDAREAFYAGLTNRSRQSRERELGFTFFALGHVIHLIQDMAQPQHARLDSHPPFTASASFIEQYVEANVGAFPLGSSAVPVVAHPRALWTDGGAGLADFSNANFVSAGTNFTVLADGATAENHPRPVLDLSLRDAINPPDACRDGTGTPGAITVFGNWVTDPLGGPPSLNPRMTSHSVFDQRLVEKGKAPLFALNCFNIDAQAERLLPRAVAYSAALLRYFFRGRLETDADAEAFYVANRTPDERMTGTFELYYDDADGVRDRLATWVLDLEPGQWSAALTTPRLPQEYATARCLLVFRGRLGDEADAVAGQLGPCPVEAAAPPPPPPPPPPLPPADWCCVILFDGAAFSCPWTTEQYCAELGGEWGIDHIGRLIKFLAQYGK
jgi:hypothetical protein